MPKPIFLLASSDRFPGLPPRSTERLKYERFMHLFLYPYIIHPYSRFRYYWDCSVCFCVFFHLVWCTLIFAAFRHGAFMYHVILMAFQFHGLLDIIINFFTGYVKNTNNEIVLFPSKIVFNYLKSWFIVDLISIVPFEGASYFIPDCFGPESNKKLGCHFLVDLFSLTFLLRIFSFHRCFNRIVLLNLMNLFYAQGVIHIFWLLGIFLAFVNLNQYIPFYHPDKNSTWIGASYDYCEEHKERRFCRAFEVRLQMFFASGLSLWEENFVYFKNYQTAEVILRIAFYSFSGFSLFTFIGVVIILVISSKSPKERYHEGSINLRTYLIKKPTTKALRRKSMLYMEIHSEKKLYDDEIVEFLPDSELEKISINMTLPVIQKVSLFVDFPKELLRDVACVTHNEIYLPYDVLTRAGDIGRSMFIIKFGTVAVYSKTFVKLTEFDDGDFFGVKSILFPMKILNASAVALKISSVCRLDRDDFLGVMQSYPEYLDQLQKILVEEKEKRDLNGI